MEIDKKKEQEIIRRIKKRDQSVVAEILDIYGNTIKSVVYQYLGELIMYREECLDDVLMAVWNHCSSFKGDISSLRNWIAGIARYKAIGYGRKYLQDLKELDIDDESVAYKLVQHMDLLEKELNEDLDKMLEKLNPFDRQLLMDLYVEEKTIEEAAASQGITTEAAYKRSQRAKKKLRGMFREKGRRYSV